MTSAPPHLPTDDIDTREAQALLAAHEGKLGPCLTTMSGQFAVLQNRSQLLLTLCTLTLTITGFSGPKIAASGMFARSAMVIGIVLVLTGLLLVLTSTLSMRFATQYLVDEAPGPALANLIHYRNRRARWYRWQVACVVFGLSFYVTAVIHYLLLPGPV